MVWNSTTSHHFPLSRQTDEGFSLASRNSPPTGDRNRLLVFEALVRRWEPIVFEICDQLFADPSVAESTCEEAFVALYRSDVDLCTTAALLSALIGYTVEIACQAIREENLVMSNRHSLCLGLGRLMPGDRDLIALRFLNGRTAPEIATLLEISEDEVRVRLWNAMTAMKRSFKSGTKN